MQALHCRVLMTKKLKKFTAKKKIWIKYYNLPIPRPPERTSKLQKKKENIKHFKISNFLILFYFCGSFLPSWIRIRIRIHGPDWIRIQSRSGSETLVFSILSCTTSTNMTVKERFLDQDLIIVLYGMKYWWKIGPSTGGTDGVWFHSTKANWRSQ